MSTAKWDENSEFPVEAFKKTAELGFAGLFIRDDVGGSNLSRLLDFSYCLLCDYRLHYDDGLFGRVDSTIIIEGLATGCVGTTAMLTIHNMCGGMIG